MGVKSYFVYSDDEAVYLGPQAYHRLRHLYSGYYRGGYTPISLTALQLPEGGWRKKIEPLYRALKGILGARLGTLRVLKISNPKKDTLFRSSLDWVIRHTGYRRPLRQQTLPRGSGN